ncbi:MAG: protein kinase [Deltaproteobacteria bacterium]|nr:protein kinase [Deltaproteobacteria bacterium]
MYREGGLRGLALAGALAVTCLLCAESQAIQALPDCSGELRPELVEAADRYMAGLGRRPDWKAILAELNAGTPSPARRFVRALAELHRKSVILGDAAESEIEGMIATAGDERLAARLLLALGRGRMARGHHGAGIETLERSAEMLRRLGDERALVRALHALGQALVHKSGRPWDAMAVLGELMVFAHGNGMRRYEQAAGELIRQWRLKMAESDDYFGRARRRIQIFPPSLGIPEDADLVSWRSGVLLMNGDTDDQMISAEPAFVTYDGLFFRRQELSERSLELRGSTVDRDGALWAATNRGLLRLDADGLRWWVNPTLPDEDGNDLAAQVRRGLAGAELHETAFRSNLVNEVKQGPDGRLYLATGAGLAIWDVSAGRLEFFGPPQAPIPKAIERAAPAPDGSISVAWKHAFAVRSPDGSWQRFDFDFTDTEGRKTGQLFGLLVDREGCTWVHGLRGAKRLKAGRILRVVDRRLNNATRNVNHVLKASDGAWWFATPEGICRQETGSRTEHCARLHAKRWMKAEWALDLFEYPPGRIWSSAYQGGLFKLEPPHYRHFGLEQGFPQPMTTTLLPLGEQLFVAHPEGLSRLDPKSGRIDNFVSGAEGIPAGEVEDGLVLEGGSLALVGRGILDGKGLVIFDGRRGRVLGPEQGLPDERIQALCQSAPDVLTVAFRTQVVEIDTRPETGSLHAAPGFDTIGAGIVELACGPGEPVWALTREHALYKIDRGSPPPSPKEPPSVARPNSVPWSSRYRVPAADTGLDGDVHHLIRDADAGLFLIGQRGVARFRGERFERLPVQADRFDFRVRDAVQDGRGRLYFSTESGVFVFGAERWTHLDAADGLVSDTAFDMLVRGERIWITGQGGVAEWRWPERETPETILILGRRAAYSDPGQVARSLQVSDGVDRPGFVQLRSTAGLFELSADRSGAFWPPGARPGQSPGDASCEMLFDTPQLTVRASAISPYRSDPPDSFAYRYRLDGGPWLPAATSFELRDLAEGAHLLELQATDDSLQTDPTPAWIRFEVDTPLSAMQLAAAGLIAAVLLFFARRRIAWLYLRWRHRGFRPIEPSPFCPNRPAEGAAFVGRMGELEQLASTARQGGVIVVWAERGMGKQSLLRRLQRELEPGAAPGSLLVLPLDLAVCAAGGSVANLVMAMSAALIDALVERGIDLELAGATLSESLMLSRPSGSGESNPFQTLRRQLRQLERARPELRVAFLLDNAEVLALALDADQTYGSYLFPFLRTLAQQRDSVAVVLAVEGRWPDIARRYEPLLAFATPLALGPLSRELSAEVIEQALRDRALIEPQALAQIVELTGGHPLLLQQLGAQLVAQMNEAHSNLLRSANVQAVAGRLSASIDAWPNKAWLQLSREEKLVAAALAELDTGADFKGADAAAVIAVLARAGGKLLAEEARRAMVLLDKHGGLETQAGRSRLRSSLFSAWIKRHYSVKAVLEETHDFVGPYELGEKLGQGGMGLVYKARDLVSGDRVAVKLLRSELSENKRCRQRFLREARLGKRIQHPHVIRIRDYGEQGGRLYLAMEYLEGVSLARWRREHPAPDPIRIGRIGQMVASALAAVHETGIIHRDVKSENIMLVGEHVKLMDFGLAVGEEVSRMTRAGSLLGTIAYMSPEQARGEELDERSDLYSLGVVLYELVAGSPPFSGTEATVLQAILHDPAPRLDPAAPEGLRALIEALLEKSPDSRPASAKSVAEALADWLARSGADTRVSMERAPAPAPEPPLSLREKGPGAEEPQASRTSSGSVTTRTLDAFRSQSLILSTLAGESSSRPESRTDRLSGDPLLYGLSARVAKGTFDRQAQSESLALCIQALQADRGLLARLDGDSLKIACACAWAGDPPMPLLRQSVAGRTGLLFSAEPGEQPSDALGSAVCAPLWAGEQIHGALLVGRAFAGSLPLAFSDDDLELLVCAGYLLGLGLERERLYQRALDEERMAAIGKMLANVAHDMRNPMSIIGGFAQLLHAEQALEKREEYCRIIQGQVDEMTAMLKNLTAFASGERQEAELHAEDICVQELGEDIRQTLAVQCTATGIELAVLAEAGQVHIDPSRTRRIIHNLARNAVEAMGGKGRLTVQLGCGEDGQLRIRVSDTGPGIPGELLPHIFEPFVTAGKSGGTGLGLSIVKRFVEDHRGEIEVSSQPGSGTTFTIQLPGAA